MVSHPFVLHNTFPALADSSGHLGDRIYVRTRLKKRRRQTKIPLEDITQALETFEMYRDEAAKCAGAGANLAGCALLASALEAALMAMTKCCWPDVAGYIKKTRAKEFSRPIGEWGLSQFLLVARDLQWLPANQDRNDKLDPTKIKVGDLVEIVRMVRNFIHPAIYLREYCGEKVTGKELAVSFQILDIACSYLSKRLDEISESNSDGSDMQDVTPEPQLLGA